MFRFRLAPAAVIGLVALAFVGSASAVSYHSPGYKGTKRFGKVVRCRCRRSRSVPASTRTCWSTKRGPLTSCSRRMAAPRRPTRSPTATSSGASRAARQRGRCPTRKRPNPAKAANSRATCPTSTTTSTVPFPWTSATSCSSSSAASRRCSNAEPDRLGQQRVRVELGRRRRDHHRPGADRRQPDGRGRDRLRRPERSLGRHDQRHRDRRHVLPGQPRRQIHDRQGTARHRRSGLLREPCARLEHAGARAGGGLRRPERERVRARVERPGRRQRRLHLVDGVVSGLSAADRRRRQRRVRALQRQLAERRQPAAATDSGRAAGRRAGGARQVDHAAGDLRGSDRADSACLHRPARCRGAHLEQRR